MTSKIVRADGTEITGIKSVTYTETVNAGDGLKPGCVASAYIEVECFGAQSNAPAAGDALTYYQVDGNGTETLIGVFYAEPSIPTKKTFKFTAYDAVSNLDKPYSERLNAIQANFPMTVYQLVSDACSVAGVTLGSSSWPLSTMNVNAFYADGLTCRNILQYAAELAGRFVRCDSSGEVIFDWYTSASTGIKPGSATGYVPYKQDGLTYDNYTVLACDAVAIKPSGTEGAAYIYPTTFGTVTATDPNGDGNVILQNLVVSDDGNGNLYLSVGAEDDNGNVEITQYASASNTLILSGNLLLTNATEQTYTAAAQNVYQVMSSLPAYRHAVVQLFNFLNPFRAGQFVSITDAQGVSFTAPIFEMRVQASGAEIKSSGKQSYEDTEQTTVAKTLANLANNIVQIDKAKIGYAEIDEAVIESLEANGINANDITVSGTLHSADYVRANNSVYADAGLGIELDSKRIAATGFAVTPEGALYAKRGLIADAHLSASTAHYYAAPPSAFLDVDGNPGSYTYDAALTENKLTAGEAGTAIYPVAKTALDGTGLNKVWCQCKSGGNEDESRPTPYGTVKYLDSNSAVLFESAYSGLRYVDASSTQGTTFTLNPTYLSQCASIRIEIRLADGDTCKLQRWYGIYAAIYYGSDSSASALKGSADGVYFGSDGISVGEDICLTPDGHLNAGVLTTSGDVLINDSDSIIRKPELDVTATSVPAEQVASFAVRDKNNVFVSWFDTYQSTNGRLRLSLVVRGKASGSVSNGIYLDVYADGTRGVTVSSPAAWRSALGVSAIQSKTVTGTTDANGFINLSLANGSYIPLAARSSRSDDNVEFATGSSSWWGRVTNRGAARGNASVTIEVHYTDKP